LLIFGTINNKLEGLIRINNKLEGLTFRFTGKLETMNRNESNNLMLTRGGTPKSGVTKNLSYLVRTVTSKQLSIKRHESRTPKLSPRKNFLR